MACDDDELPATAKTSTVEFSISRALRSTLAPLRFVNGKTTFICQYCMNLKFSAPNAVALRTHPQGFEGDTPGIGSKSMYS